ncbi:MAG: hypothetical protein IKO72_08700 [Kiritimatiellae bacterium]|nr:hypothetical protein [Kiritimatiellia bacterium]
MKNMLKIFCAVTTVLVATLTTAATPKTLDPATVSRLESFIKTKRQISREVIGANVVYTFTQGGKTWSETNAVRHVDGTIQPTRYSRLKLYAAIAQMGKWDALETWLKSQTINGVNAYTAFLIANDLRTDHPLFMQYFTAAKQVLGVDDATADAILAQCEE